MKVQHIRKPHLIGGRLLRLAWSVTGFLPKRFRSGNFIGKWRSRVSEWAWVHRHTCKCWGCMARRDVTADFHKAYGIAYKGYLHAQGFVTAEEMKSAYIAAFGYRHAD
jgi:hypothetical protein